MKVVFSPPVCQISACAGGNAVAVGVVAVRGSGGRLRDAAGGGRGPQRGGRRGRGRGPVLVVAVTGAHASSVRTHGRRGCRGHGGGLQAARGGRLLLRLQEKKIIPTC